MSEPTDEFSFLAEQAADAGIDGPIPAGERLALTLADGRTLSALRYGGADPVVTFLHGAGLNAHTWDTTILALGLPALAIDLPGHGDSSWRDDAAYAARVLAPDVVEAIGTWTSRPQLLVGQSLGGLTAAAVAASRSDLVRELVVVDITPGIDSNGGASQLVAFFAGPKDWASRDELLERALSFGLGGSRTAAARGVYFNSRVRPDGRVEWKHHFAHLANALAEAGAADASTGSATGEAAARESATGGAGGDASTGSATGEAGGDTVRAALAVTGWDDLAAVTAPLTLIRGDHGYVTDADAEEFARRVPTASIEVVSSGHNVQEELPKALGERLRTLAGKD